MNARILHRFLGIAVAVILILASRAASAGMPAERSFTRAGWDRGPVVQIGPGTSARQVVDYFAVDYVNATGNVLSWRVLYDANPRSTIATCAFRTDGQPTFNPRNPHDDSVWDGCDPSKQNIALVAGAYLRVPMENAEEAIEGDDIEMAYDDLTHALGCDSPEARHECAKKKIAELKKAPRPSSSPMETKPSDSTGASDEILNAVVAQRDTARVEILTLTGELIASKAEAQTRVPYGKWVKDLLVACVISLLFGAAIVETIERFRGRKRASLKDSISTQGAMQAATVPTNSQKTGKASRDEKTQMRLMPPPTG